MNWQPEQKLAALLDGLTEELPGSFEHEVRVAPGTSSEELEAMRHLVAAADIGVAPVSHPLASGLRSWFTRVQ